MTIEEVLLSVNNNVRTLVEDLRKRIEDVPEIDETVDKRRIIYQYSGEDFCMINIKKDYLEIDFKSDNILEDPMEFSWKIKPSCKGAFDRRMHLKNNFHIETAFGLMIQSYNVIKNQMDTQ